MYIIDIEIDTGIASSPYKAGTGYRLGWFFDTKTNTNTILGFQPSTHPTLVRH
jgi:hypothetical protein